MCVSGGRRRTVTSLVLCRAREANEPVVIVCVNRGVIEFGGRSDLDVVVPLVHGRAHLHPPR